jgi:hypothetical protein
MPTIKKDDMIIKLVEHLKNKDGGYFIEKINETEVIHNKYISKWLSSMSLKDIKNLYDNVFSQISNSPDKSPLKNKDVEKVVIVDNVANKQIINYQDFLPFDTVRYEKNFEETIQQLVDKYSRNKSKLQKAIMVLSQLFKNDIIKTKDYKYNLFEVKIVDYLSLRDDTLLYIGIVISSGELMGKKVVVKVQPRIPPLYKRDDVDKKKGIDLNFGYQVSTESHIMSKFTKNCKKALVPQAYSYGGIKPIIEGDIERYVLISELLGNDLSKVLKGATVENIKIAMIKSIYALKTIHGCDLKNNNVSFIHKDIKHENIVFTDSSYKNVKIIDFGSTENLFDVNRNRNLKPRTMIEGTPLYMATMQHITSLDDYMDDFQAFAWMILDLLGDKPIGSGMPWAKVSNVKNANKERYDKKIEFMKKCNDRKYVSTIENGTLSAHNISVIGELANYTVERATDKVNKYDTDIKITIGHWSAYYSIYNEKYYTDIEKIINKLK